MKLTDLQERVDIHAPGHKVITMNLERLGDTIEDLKHMTKRGNAIEKALNKKDIEDVKLTFDSIRTLVDNLDGELKTLERILYEA